MKTSIIERSVCEHAVQECNEEDDDRYGLFQCCSQKSTVAVLHRFLVYEVAVDLWSTTVCVIKIFHDLNDYNSTYIKDIRKIPFD